VARFGEQLDQEISRLIAAWRAGTYRPQPVRRTWIPKPGSTEWRPLGIPAVRDRVVQAALRLVLEPIFEKTFHPHSYGFRPKRGGHDAAGTVLSSLKQGRLHVVDADLKAYFDSIPHGRLLEAVSRKVTDGRILELIGMFLKAGVMENAELTYPVAGTPQGGVISPLLANIYLNDLDWQMAEAGLVMVRYADDFVVLCRDQEEAANALERVRAWTLQAGLQLHPDKTRVVDMSRQGAWFDFLGFRFKRYDRTPGRLQILRLVRAKSLSKCRDSIRAHTRRNADGSLERVIARLNVFLRGWFGYFRSVHRKIHQALDRMVRRRLRSIQCRREGRCRWGGGMAHQRMPNAYFEKLGLFSLKAAHSVYCHSCLGTR
jgi:RNA-directed DNA polymerase